MKWERQEPGWYTSELGGICLERDGKWYFYSILGHGEISSGPYTTLKVAQKFVEEWERVH